MTWDKGHSHITNRSNHSPHRKCPPIVWNYVLFLSVEKSNRITNGQVTWKETNNVRVGISSNIDFSNSKGPRVSRGHRDEGPVFPRGWWVRSRTFHWSSWVFRKMSTSFSASAISPICVEVGSVVSPQLWGHHPSGACLQNLPVLQKLSTCYSWVWSKRQCSSFLLLLNQSDILQSAPPGHDSMEKILVIPIPKKGICRNICLDC